MLDKKRLYKRIEIDKVFNKVKAEMHLMNHGTE